MEKLQPILSAIKKHHFWMVCVIAIGAIFGGLYLAQDDLKQSFDKNKAEVKRKFDDVAKIEIKPIAGQTWPEEADKKVRALHGELTNAAKKLQAGQENEWPKALGNEFQAAVIKFGRKGNWPAERLEAFQKNAAEEVDRLKKFVNPNEGPQAGGVQWDEEDFQQWREQFVWATPINAEVMFEAQEKLWVAKAVLQSIVSTNEGAPDRFNLPISAIDVFEIGPAALRNRPARAIEVQGPPPAPIAAPVPAAQPGAAPPGAPGAPGAAPVAKPPAPAPVAPPAAIATVRPVSGLRAIPVRIRLKMNPDMLGRLDAAMINQRGVPMIIDDVYFIKDVKLVLERGQQPPAAPAPEPGKAVPAAPGANFGGAPAGVAPGAAAPGVAAPGAQGPGGPGGPGDAEAPVAAPVGTPHLVQVPRGAIVEIQATAYFVDMGQVEALKVAMGDRGRL